MISNGMYADYQTLESQEEVYAWINEGTPMITNYPKDYKAMIDRLMTNKRVKKRNYKSSTYRNIYAHTIKVGIPKCLEKDRHMEFVYRYVEKMDIRFKKLLWLAKFYQNGEGKYADIMFFDRTVYDTPKVIKNVKYNQDYYYNKHTGQRCKKDNPDKVLKHKKGDVKRDDDGNKIRDVQYVSQKAGRMFTYKSFARFSRKLRKKVERVVKEMESQEHFYQMISKVTVKEDDSKTVRKLKILKNENIDKVNVELKEYQIAIERGFKSDKELKMLFKEFLKEINAKVYEHKEDFCMILSYMKDWWRNIAIEQ